MTEGNKKIATERKKLETIQIEIKAINDTISTEAKPLITEIDKITKQIQETSRKLIDKCKITRTLTINKTKTETETEEQEIALINEEIKGEAEILGRLALAVHAINVALQFDEEYETPQNIELFINHFEGVEKQLTGKYMHGIEKYKEHMKTL